MSSTWSTVTPGIVPQFVGNAGTGFPAVDGDCDRLDGLFAGGFVHSERPLGDSERHDTHGGGDHAICQNRPERPSPPLPYPPVLFSETQQSAASHL